MKMLWTVDILKCQIITFALHFWSFHILDDNTNSMCFNRHRCLNSCKYFGIETSSMVSKGPWTVYCSENISQPVSPSKLLIRRTSKLLRISGSSYCELVDRNAASKIDDNSKLYNSFAGRSSSGLKKQINKQLTTMKQTIVIYWTWCCSYWCTHLSFSIKRPIKSPWPSSKYFRIAWRWSSSLCGPITMSSTFFDVFR